MFKEDWNTLQHLMASNDLEGAELLLKAMHLTYHKHALLHARIHFAWSRIDRMRKNYLGALGQWIAGAIFAIPVSIVQKLRR